MAPVSRAVRVAPGVDLHALVWEPRDPRREPDVLLVHGLASNAQLWLGVGQQLADAGHRVVAVDQRGHGLSAKVDDGYDPPTLTADLRAVCRALGVERPLAVGQSWGADVVVHLATVPGTVRGVACVDGGFLALAHAFDDRDEALAVLTPPPLAGLRTDELEAGMRARLVGWPEEGVQGQLGNFVRHPDGTCAPHLTLERHLTIVRSMWDHPATAAYPDVTVPVLFLPASGGIGGDDREAAIAAATAALPAARTTWLHGGHDVHAEDPAQTTAALLAALADGFWP